MNKIKGKRKRKRTARKGSGVGKKGEEEVKKIEWGEKGIGQWEKGEKR